MVAAHSGKAEAVRLLLSKGSNSNAKSNSGETALMLAKRMAAAGFGNNEVIQALMPTREQN